MVSISSARLIYERTKKFCNTIEDWTKLYENEIIFEKINDFLKSEYELIPEKERIGKGIVYISKYVAKELFKYLRMDVKTSKKDFISFIKIYLYMV